MKRLSAIVYFVSFATLILVVALPSLAQEDSYSNEYVEAQGSPRSPIDNQRVFLLGNSQVAGSFGVAMLAHVTGAGASYYARAGQPGWGVRNWWVHRHNINRFMGNHQPTLVLIELGGNDWQRSRNPNYHNEVEQLWEYIREKAEANKPSGQTVSYCWISPAVIVGDDERAREKQRGRDQAARIIHEVVGPEHYIESRDITGTFGRTGDGLHFTFEGANDWASRVIPRIENCILNQLR